MVYDFHRYNDMSPAQMRRLMERSRGAGSDTHVGLWFAVGYAAFAVVCAAVVLSVCFTRM